MEHNTTGLTPTRPGFLAYALRALCIQSYFGHINRWVELPIYAQKHWVTTTPVWSAAAPSCRSQRCSRPHHGWLRHGWHNLFARPALSSSSGRSAPSPSYPSSYLFGSCCPPGHALSATPDARHWRLRSPVGMHDKARTRIALHKCHLQGRAHQRCGHLVGHGPADDFA